MIEGRLLLEGVNVLAFHGAMPASVSGLTADSRRVKPGDAFVALRGQSADGHLYLRAAAEQGAVLAVVEEFSDAVLPQARVSDTLAALPALAANFYRHPAQSLSLIGVTGSNGKTTTTYLLEQLFQAAGESIAVLGTIEYRFGDFHETAETTTPLPHEMQRILCEVAGRGARRAAMEVSSHGLVLHRVDGMTFDTAVFTNLSQDHLDFHKTMDDYREAKKLLFTRHLKSGGTASFNLDDETGRRFQAELNDLRQLNFAIDRDAELRASRLEMTLEGCRFQLDTPEGAFNLMTPLQGRHNVYNILGALAAGLSCGLAMDGMAAAVERFHAAPGRLEQVKNGIGALVVVDYCHTPDALEKCLETLNAIPHRRLYTVFGCGGDRDRGKRPLMGAIALRLSDHAFVTSDNPRTENPEGILNDIVEGMKGGEAKFDVIADRKQAIRAAVEQLGEGDILLLAGKGHETYQILGREKIHFDDREIAGDYLIAAGKGAAN
ncbi:MAG: UDP-N-acetylmuramoyl-L-alanyl-D-glutamate--2,6-diaminopimelate ligase [bacterium]|nr:UDP-N-acetylmuramoyl-L-alanyl-D-glutamate--2,6-diaminopimelate ligase [bacterium]